MAATSPAPTVHPPISLLDRVDPATSKAEEYVLNSTESRLLEPLKDAPYENQHGAPDKQSPSANIQEKTLELQDLEPWMDEKYLEECCKFNHWEVTEVRLLRNSASALITFASADKASEAMAKTSSSAQFMPTSSKLFKLSWPTPQKYLVCLLQDYGQNPTADAQVSVFLKSIFPSCTVSLATDSLGNPRPFGLVYFTEINEFHRALLMSNDGSLAVHGHEIRLSQSNQLNEYPESLQTPSLTANSYIASHSVPGKPVGGTQPSHFPTSIRQQTVNPYNLPKINTSLPMNTLNNSGSSPINTTSVDQPYYGPSTSSAFSVPNSAPARVYGQSPNSAGIRSTFFPPQNQQRETPMPSKDPNNTTVFVGGLPACISEDTLRNFFRHFGEITYCKIPPGKGCGFVQFVRRADAEMAIVKMNDFPIHGKSRIRLSWGRSQGDKQVEQVKRLAAALGVQFDHIWNIVQSGTPQSTSPATPISPPPSKESSLSSNPSWDSLPINTPANLTPDAISPGFRSPSDYFLPSVPQPRVDFRVEPVASATRILDNVAKDLIGEREQRIKDRYREREPEPSPLDEPYSSFYRSRGYTTTSFSPQNINANNQLPPSFVHGINPGPSNPRQSPSAFLPFRSGPMSVSPPSATQSFANSIHQQQQSHPNVSTPSSSRLQNTPTQNPLRFTPTNNHGYPPPVTGVDPIFSTGPFHGRMRQSSLPAQSTIQSTPDVGQRPNTESQHASMASLEESFRSYGLASPLSPAKPLND